MHDETQGLQRKRGRLPPISEGATPHLAASMARSLPPPPADKPIKRHRSREEEADQFTETKNSTAKLESNAGNPNVTLEVDEFLSERLHAVYYRQAYRMTPNHFWRLYKLLLPHFEARAVPNAGSSNRNTCLALKISCALRYFAGGDSAGDHNIGDARTVESYVWEVVDAIHACEGLAIEFPATDKQTEVAAGFELLMSDIGIPSCAGALGSMLVWIEPPAAHSSPSEDGSGTDSNIYYNRNLNKFGLSMQAVCDHDGRFLNASIDFPGSVSDGDAFSKAELSRSLKSSGLMAQGLAFFGGEAYTGCDFVVTPIDEPKSPDERRFNDYHLQLSEIADSAFLTLLRRWSLLRRPLPQRFGVAKQRSLALALVKLHNFCMDDTEPMLPALAKDMLYGFDRGAFVLKESILNSSARGGKDSGDSSAPAKCEVVGCGGRILPRQAVPCLSPRESEIRLKVLELVREQ